MTEMPAVQVGDLLVIGPARLDTELLTVALGDVGGERAVEGVTVLVDPGPEHWAIAHERGGGIVVIVRDFDHDVVAAAVEFGADMVLPDQAFLSEVRAAAARVAALGLTRVSERIEFTNREQEILAGIAVGQTVKQTASSLGISVKTVENLQGRMFRKLGVRNRAHALRRAHLGAGAGVLSSGSAESVVTGAPS